MYDGVMLVCGVGMWVVSVGGVGTCIEEGGASFCRLLSCATSLRNSDFV